MAAVTAKNANSTDGNGKQYWAGYQLPFRPQMGTVCLFDRSTFPSIDTKLFDHLKTPEDVHKESDILNQKYYLYGKTQVNKKKYKHTRIMLTSDGLSFSHNPKTNGIYLHTDTKTYLQVAISISEFYARIDMELSIDKLFSNELIPIPGTVGSKLFLTGCSGGWYDVERNKLDLKQLWQVEAPKFWTAIQCNYLSKFATA
jgi:hypothetical protein